MPREELSSGGKKNGKNKQCDLKKGACWNRGWAMEARGVLEIAD